jgi:Tol biopolymer transport system component
LLKLFAPLVFSLLVFTGWFTSVAVNCQVVTVSFQIPYQEWTLYIQQREQYLKIATIKTEGFADLSPDGQLLAAIETEQKQYDSQPVIYDLSSATPEIPHIIPSHHDRAVYLRQKSWNNQSSKILLRDNFPVNRNNLLFIYDVQLNTYYSPTKLAEVFHPTWSPDGSLLAFLAYEFDYLSPISPLPMEDYAVYVTSSEGVPYKTIPLEASSLDALQWLRDGKLALTFCMNSNCQIKLINLETDAEIQFNLGSSLLFYDLPDEKWLLTDLSTRSLNMSNLYLFDLNTQRRKPLVQVDSLISQPNLSADGQFIAYRALVDGVYQILITNLKTFETHVQPLNDPIPEIWFNNGYNAPDNGVDKLWLDGVIWHPSENTFLFPDNNLIYLHDVETQSARPLPDLLIGESLRPVSWKCS